MPNSWPFHCFAWVSLTLSTHGKRIHESIISFVQDAKEYVTPEHLEKEIMDEIIVHGGRVHLTEIQPNLNVDLRHVQDKAAKLVKEDPSMRLIDGEVFTSDYLDSLAEEINQVLHEAGQLRLVELASKYTVTTQFMIEILTTRLGSIVHGHMESGMIYTPTYIDRQTSCIRGAFSAITKPTPVASLQGIFNFDESLFETTVLKLISEGRLKGTLSGRGMRATYTPATFSQAQLKSVRQFFSQNGYIEYSTAEKMLVSNPKGFLGKELGEEGHALKSCFVSKHLIEQVDAAVEDALTSDSWVCVTPLLPSFMDVPDAAAVLQRCDSIKDAKRARIMAEVYVVSSGFLGKCVEHVKQRAAEKADYFAQALKSEMGMEGGDSKADMDDDDDDGGRGRKKGGKKAAADDDDDDDGKKGKVSKRQEQKEAASKQKEKNKAKAAAKEDKPGSKSGGGGKCAGFDYDAETTSHVQGMLQGVEDDVIEEFLPELVAAIRPQAKEAYQAAARTIFSSGAQRRQKREALQQTFIVLYHQLCALRKGKCRRFVSLDVHDMTCVVGFTPQCGRCQENIAARRTTMHACVADACVCGLVSYALVFSRKYAGLFP
jgi:hypothetical protein